MIEIILPPVRTPAKRMLKNKLEEITAEDILRQDWFIHLEIPEKIKQIMKMIRLLRFFLKKDPCDFRVIALIEMHYIQLNRCMALAVENNLVNWGAND